MKKMYFAFMLMMILIPLSAVAGGDRKEVDLKLDINSIFDVVIAKAEQYWGTSIQEKEVEALPKLASSYIHVGIRFDELATQLLRTIPNENREFLCTKADTGTLDCLKFIEKTNSEYNGEFDKVLLRQKLDNLRYMYSSLRRQFEELSYELIISDIDLNITLTRNVAARNLVLEDGEKALFNGTFKKYPVKTLEIASRFERLGDRAVTLGRKIIALVKDKKTTDSET